MIILGIETSCDDTACAILKDGSIVTEAVSSQLEHASWGGVVPEIASRAHLRNILPVVKTVLLNAGIELGDIDLVAVTAGPGLAGALLVGINFARGISDGLSIPMLGINHLQAHIWAAEIDDSPIKTPFIALLVSGGHTSLVRVDSYREYTTIGQTLDDAAGEVLDKVGRLLGLEYPAGAAIDEISSSGDFTAVDLPRGMIKSGDCNFSFSGLKTAARLFLEKNPQYVSGQKKTDFIASLQEAVVDSLVFKTLTALKNEGIDRLVIGGGVSANTRLRHRFEQVKDVQLRFASKNRSTDNGAMIAYLAYNLGIDLDANRRNLTANPGLSIEMVV